MKTAITAFYIFLLSISGLPIMAQEKLSIAGEWHIRLDADSSFYKKKQLPSTFPDIIQLPGTTDEAKLGTKTQYSDYGILTRAYKYIGPAYYQRVIDIPASWSSKNITLFLERVLWESRVYIDDRELSTTSPLYVPHQHALGKLSPGKHVLTICINNDLIHNIGDKGHGYTEYTQSIWNGIVGRIELQASDPISIKEVKTYPATNRQSIKAKISLDKPINTLSRFVIEASLKEISTARRIKSFKKNYTIKSGEQSIEVLISDLNNVKAWDEFNPNLYELSITLTDGKNKSHWKENTGFRNLATNQHKILVNDQPTFIRGNLDCVHFPLTGYPSCNVKDWELIFKKYKDYGLNTVRFHSWCPPKAAFEAADKMGIYIQAEIIWLDWWMAGEQEDRPEMNTKGYPQGLGKNPGADAFVQAEMQRVLDAYGNHPSFMFFCIGNELGNSDFDVMQNWIRNVKQNDNRRLYAVSTARKIMPVDDYSVTHNIPNIGGTYGYSLNKTDAGLEANYSRANIPIIAHEVGQAPVYPLWSEISKYKGVLKARNLEGFKQIAQKNGIEQQDEDFHKATGHLQQVLYKNLIENVMLAPSSAGFQLLSMQDYQGQGEALIGWLDCFWDDKGTTDPKTFKGYSNAVVPLIRTSTFTYTTSDTMHLSIEVANYFKTDLNKKLHWEIKDENGKTINSGITATSFFPQGKLSRADSIDILCKQFPEAAGMYNFRLYFEDHSYSNSWDFFVFPENKEKTATGSIYVSNEWDRQTDSVLAGGGKVLLIANKLGSKASSGNVFFTPLFWSASFFPGQGNETLGSMINEKSEAFRYFPTRYFTNWQWYKITPGAKYFRLSEMPSAFVPLMQPVSDFHYNEKLGSIFETKAGNGKLLVCGYNIDQPANAYAQQLYFSLIKYMNSSAFTPAFRLPAEKLKLILQRPQEAHTILPLPDEFKSASLFINAAKNIKDNNSWKVSDDKISVNTGYKYHLSNTVTSTENGWSGKNFAIDIEPPKGVKGYIYVHLTNTGDKKLSGSISVESRETRTGTIPSNGKWVKIFMMREDTNDGKLQINIISDNRENLSVDQLVIMEEE